MKALVKTGIGAGQMSLQDVPEPVPQAGEVLIEIGATGICGTDLHIAAGEYPVQPPVILGHEFSGIIRELGADVEGWQVGDRVTSVPYAVVCGRCIYCRSGQLGLCHHRRSYGSGVNGAFAKYLAVNASGLYRLFPDQSLVAGALTEPLACVTKAVYEIGLVQPGERVIVLGPGPIGLLTLQVVQAAGGHVSLVGLRRDARRMELGRTLGAEIFYADDHDVLTQLAASFDPAGADVVFECSGAGAAFDVALQAVRPQGRVIQVGLFGKAVMSNLDLIVKKDLAVRGSFASSLESWERALELTGSGFVDSSRMISDTFPLDEWEAAFRRAASGEGLKVIIEP